MAAHDLDASFLMWDIRRNVHTDKLPPQAVREVDITLVTSLRTMTQIWMGDLSLAQARANGLLKVFGAALVRSLTKWLGPSPFAHVARASQSEAAIA